MSLPNGYKRLEYIQSSGTQYINTGITINATTYKRYRFLFDIGYPSIGGSYWLVNGNSGSNVTYYFGLSNAGKIVYGNGTADVFGSVTATTGRYLIDFNPAGGSYKFGDLQHLTGLTFNAPRGSQNFYLFAYNKGNGQDMHTERLYSAKIYDTGTIVRDFIPCQKPDGTIGLWDDVNSVFYGNAGTGTFTAGPVIAIAADKSEVTELKYIQSTGTQHLDSLFKPNNHTRAVIDFQSTFSTANSPKGLLGSRNSSDIGMFAFLYLNRIDPNYNGVGKSVTVDSLQRHVYDFNQNSFSVDGDVVSFDAGIFSPGYNLLLLSVQNYGTIDNRKAEGYLYSCQIYDNGTLIRNYIAAKLSDGTVGLYDKLNGLLYINAGNGTFTEGPVAITVPSTPLNFILSSSTDTTVTLSWDVVEDATGYKLYRNGSLVTILFSTSYTDTIEPFTDYVYTLIAYNENGESDPATLDVFVIIPPVQPKYFNFIGANNSSIWLSWQPVNHADMYKLYRDDTLLHETKDTKYIDTELNVNTQYNYTLVASNSSGDSPKSNILKASTISLDLVYDRTQEDGNKIAQYIQTKFSNLSEEQQAEWLSYHSKGGWNYTDLNRIEYWIGYITELLGLYIESLDDIPKFEASWDKRSNLYVEDVTHIQEVIELLKTKFKLTEFDWETMQRGPNWDYKQANAIERNLKTLYEQFYYMYIWPVCGDTTCGGDYL